jgi:hypothetical protein
MSSTGKKSAKPLQNIIHHSHQSFPRIFVEESHSHIEGRASPAFQGIGVCQGIACLFRNINHINGTQPRGQQRLMGITPSGVHDESTRILANGLSERFRSLLDDDVAPSNLAWLAAVERWTGLWVLTILQTGNDYVRLETGLSLLMR